MRTLWALLVPPWKRSEGSSGLRKWAFVLAAIQVVVGLVIWIGFGLAHVTAANDDTTSVFWERAQQDQPVTFKEKRTYYWSGALGFVGFLLTPPAWVALYLIVEGSFRWLNACASEEIMGSLVAYAVVPLIDGGRRRRARRRRHRDFGEEMPDKIRWNRGPNKEWVLEIVSSHDKPWREAATIRIRDTLYALSSVSERRAGGRLRICYRLSPWPTGKIVRSLVVYEPPGGLRPPPDADAAPERTPNVQEEKTTP